jgi:hypothetical protein
MIGIGGISGASDGGVTFGPTYYALIDIVDGAEITIAH